ncbi:hypothetical protein L1987_80327 [Smallanthus sonchifolius]|uniref:Uncharacterized protein n=1 Tax=Smallanthus sonchifolius TaxID=185202 RepID=A0ACB8YME4_9ASTR|nr:hypothetical protein L1987_80327 [Smallanthus sonchifolius]
MILLWNIVETYKDSELLVSKESRLWLFDVFAPLAINVVCINPQKRQIYDLYSEEALKSGQVPPPPPFSSSHGYYVGHHYNNNNHQHPNPNFRFNPRDAGDIYAELFGGSEAGGSSGRSAGRGFKDGYFRNANAGESSSAKKAPVVEISLSCSLVDLYKGAKKKIKISRTILDSLGS